MIDNFLTLQIKYSLKQGGLSLTERASGKTTAIVKLLRDNSDYRMMVHSQQALDHVIYEHRINPDRIFTPENIHKKIRGTYFDPAKHLLVDEYFLCGSPFAFFAATASPHFKVRPVLREFPTVEPLDLVEAALFGDLPQKELSKQIDILNKKEELKRLEDPLED